VKLDLRQVRCFVVVAERRSFTRAAEELYIAQQAVSQQIKALESVLGVDLLKRSSRQVELTRAGTVFLADCRRLLAAADCAVAKAQAAARGEAGILRLVYTLSAAYDTVPRLLARLGERHPQLTVEAREVFGADVLPLLSTSKCDVALAPSTAYPPGELSQQLVRLEPLQLAVGEGHELAGGPAVPLARLRDERLEVWPREVAPGCYDAIVSACRAAGFEPRLDEHAAGSTVWGYIAQGRGLGLVVRSMCEQLPRGIRVVDIGPPQPAPVRITAVWLKDGAVPTLDRLLEAAAQLSVEQSWT
jgi:DNA-binding transcriptional LysR family regulator